MRKNECFQHLLKCDGCSFTISPVSGIRDMQQAVQANSEQIKRIVLLNCGANFNLMDLLQPPEDVIFFLLDSHRPFDLENVYDGRQFMLLVRSDEENELKCPDYKEIYNEEFENPEFDDESDSDASTSGEEDVFESPAKKKPTRLDRLNRRAEKIHLRKEWMKTRGDLLWNYYENSYYSTSSSCIMLQVCQALSKTTTEVLWWALVGFTSQFLDGKIGSAQYTKECMDELLLILVRRLGKTGDEESQSTSALKIQYDKELMLPLYRQWSLYDSIWHCALTACQFQLWAPSGPKRLNRFLADLGLPLRECKQKFGSMPSELRKTVVEKFDAKLEDWEMSALIGGMFVASFSYTHRWSAADFANSLAALLEMSKSENDGGEAFHRTLNSFSLCQVSSIYDGLQLYKDFMSAQFREVSAVLRQGSIMPSASFLLLSLSPGNPDLRYFLRPSGLFGFGRFLLRAFLSNPRAKDRHGRKPLLLVVPMPDADQGWCLVAGIPPMTVQNEPRPKNLLGRAFERVADQTGCRVHQDSFDTAIVRVKVEDKARFLDCLGSLLC